MSVRYLAWVAYASLISQQLKVFFQRILHVSTQSLRLISTEQQFCMELQKNIQYF